ncbi:MAG: hypothetical protein AAF849_24685, partial [Bacteroidota bacterium]
GAIAESAKDDKEPVLPGGDELYGRGRGVECIGCLGGETFPDLPEFDDLNNFSPKFANEYVRDQDGNHTKISDVGGDDFDIIYDGTVNDDGSISIIAGSALVIGVEITPTSGPGNIFSQDTDPTPGHREIHARSPTIFGAVVALFSGGTGGSTTKLGLAALNKNSNKAKGKFATYLFKLFGKTHKVGKADASRITKSTGLPTRVHQQRRKLVKKHGEDNVSVSVSQLGKTTTKEAKRVETSILKKIFKRTGKVPKGNERSFKPKK